MKIVYFAPYSAIWLHAVPEALTAAAMQQRGHEIVYATCGNLFKESCVSMSAHGIDYTNNEHSRQKVCDTCNKHKHFIKTEFNLNGFELSDFISPTDKKLVTDITTNLEFQDFDYQYDDIKLGRAALYLLILRHKKTNLNFSQAQWEEYLIELKHTLYAYISAKKILIQEKPDCTVIYNTRYPTNNAFRLASLKMNATPYFIHMGSNMSGRVESLQLAKNDHSQLVTSQLAAWDKFKQIPCAKKTVDYIANHFLELCRGKNIFVYSEPSSRKSTELYDYFGINKNQSVCVAITSSADEYYAQYVFENFLRNRTERVAFESQEAWLSELINYFKKHPELFLIIRLHPRIFPNRRDGVESEYVNTLKNLFQDLPGNIKINWPEQKISLYDIANITDLFLNSWSSVGKEMSLLGIPVLSYGHSWLLYPFDLNYLGDNPDKYFLELEKALLNGWDFENARLAFRWYALEQIYSVINISDRFTFTEYQNYSLKQRVYNKVRRTLNMNFPIIKALNRNKSSLNESKKFYAVLENNWDTPLDGFDQQSLSINNHKDETKYIEEALLKMIERISKDENIDGRINLFKKLNNYLKKTNLNEIINFEKQSTVLAYEESNSKISA